MTKIKQDEVLTAVLPKIRVFWGVTVLMLGEYYTGRSKDRDAFSFVNVMLYRQISTDVSADVMPSPSGTGRLTFVHWTTCP